jgi:hypothetical protein
MFPVTQARVAHHTRPAVNERIRVETEERVRAAAMHGPDEVSARLKAVREEWDIDRVVEATAGGLALAGCALAAVDRRWLLVPTACALTLVQHALFGWSPLGSVLRRLDVRTAGEIERERTLLVAAQEAATPRASS